MNSYKVLEVQQNSKLYVKEYNLNGEVILSDDFFISNENLQMLNEMTNYEEQQDFLKSMLLNDNYHYSQECNISIGYNDLEHMISKNIQELPGIHFGSRTGVSTFNRNLRRTPKYTFFRCE